MSKRTRTIVKFLKWFFKALFRLKKAKSSLLRCPKFVWKGSIENYPLENYPDYEPGKPPRLEKLHRFSYLDEVEKIWGAKWAQGAQGIGKLKEVALVRPTEHEANPLWAKDPYFFLLRQGVIKKEEIPLLIEQHEKFAKTLKENGVTVHWMEIGDVMGALWSDEKIMDGRRNHSN
jgi:hypothetical protein